MPASSAWTSSRVAARLDGRRSREQADAAVARRLHRGVRLGRDDADDRHRELLLQLRQRCGRRAVARDDDELHVLLREVRRDLAREAADLLERARAVRQPRMVAEEDEVLVRHRHEALVEDGQAADSRIEDAHGARIHGCHRSEGVRWNRGPGRSRRSAPRRSSAQAALRLRTPADRPRQEVTITGAGGVQLACDFVLPAGTAPDGGWPAIVLFPGLGFVHAPEEYGDQARFASARVRLCLVRPSAGRASSGGSFDLAGPSDAAGRAGDLRLARRPARASPTRGSARTERISAARRSGTRPSPASRSRRSSRPTRGRVSVAHSSPTGVRSTQARSFRSSLRRVLDRLEHRRRNRRALVPRAPPLAHRPDTDHPKPRENLLWDLSQATAAYRLLSGPKRLSVVWRTTGRTRSSAWFKHLPRRRTEGRQRASRSSTSSPDYHDDEVPAASRRPARDRQSAGRGPDAQRLAAREGRSRPSAAATSRSGTRARRGVRSSRGSRPRAGNS